MSVLLTIQIGVQLEGGGNLKKITKGGADSVVFGSWLYVGAADFIRKFQGSPLVEYSEVWQIWNCEEMGVEPQSPANSFCHFSLNFTI